MFERRAGCIVATRRKGDSRWPETHFDWLDHDHSKVPTDALTDFTDNQTLLS